MKVAIYGSVRKAGFMLATRTLMGCLQRGGCEVLLFDEVADFILKQDGCLPRGCEVINKGTDFSADLVFSMGGDGTFLKAAMKVRDRGIPIAGIKLGNLGFLVDIQADEIESSVAEILLDGYDIEERSLLWLETTGQRFTNGEPYALNEVAIFKRDTSSMIKIDARINGEFFCCYRADGLLASTPTGSTAYAMSVGAPILAPENKCTIISPVAPHSLNLRPVVIPDGWEIDLKVYSRSENFMISLDGRSQVMDKHTGLHIKKAPFTIKLVRRHGRTYFRTLREKFLWGADVRRDY